MKYKVWKTTLREVRVATVYELIPEENEELINYIYERGFNSGDLLLGTKTYNEEFGGNFRKMTKGELIQAIKTGIDFTIYNDTRPQSFFENLAYYIGNTYAKQTWHQLSEKILDIDTIDIDNDDYCDYDDYELLEDED